MCVWGGMGSGVGGEVVEIQCGNAHVVPVTVINGVPPGPHKAGSHHGPFPFGGHWEQHTEGGAAIVCGDRSLLMQETSGPGRGQL